ncbi:MAG: hypothetical protein F4X64_02965 [Chloroflexi bacterium]|nr:hypothetical protein [Chloroflexota bacterium]
MPREAIHLTDTSLWACLPFARSQQRPIIAAHPNPSDIARGKRFLASLSDRRDLPAQLTPYADPIRIKPGFRNSHRARIMPSLWIEGRMPGPIPPSWAELVNRGPDGKRSFHALRLGALLLSEIADLKERRRAYLVRIPLRHLAADLWPERARARDKTPILAQVLPQLLKLRSRGEGRQSWSLPVFKELRIAGADLTAEIWIPNARAAGGAMIDFQLLREIGGHGWRNGAYLAAAWLADGDRLAFGRDAFANAAAAGLDPPQTARAQRRRRAEAARAARWLSNWRDAEGRAAIRLAEADSAWRIAQLHGRDKIAPGQLELSGMGREKRGRKREKRGRKREKRGRFLEARARQRPKDLQRQLGIG